MKSMTGFGHEERVEGNLQFSIEIKGYNNRFLEVFVNLPPFLTALEPRFREAVAKRCQRGKVEVAIRVKELSSSTTVTVDEGAAKAYYVALVQLSDSLGLGQKPSLKDLIGLDGVLTVQRDRDVEQFWASLEAPLGLALDRFEKERVREGASTEVSILGHLAILEKNAALVSDHVPGIEASIKDNLRSRFKDLLGDSIDENRILAETAVLLMKYTIAEELSRLAAHLGEFRSEVKANPSPGKKLDFLCQEINREVNTIGSKSPVLEVSRAVVEMKDALENIREQLRNVE